VLKIDRSFVRDLTKNPEARILVDTILAMAHAPSLFTVAEGVETEQEAAILHDRDRRLGRGYRSPDGAHALSRGLRAV
jgi:EAL domain-containing protein (putative c-di-GMP-specific phosphodiesterase class I)